MVVNLQLSDASLDATLREVFANTGLTYTVDETDRVWITRFRKLQLGFSPNYFNIREELDRTLLPQIRQIALPKIKSMISGDQAHARMGLRPK